MPCAVALCSVMRWKDFYPDKLSYLEEHYGITYDKEKYIVSYEVVGSNMMPDIMVITLNRSKEERP